MRIIIKGSDFKVTPAIEQYLRKRIAGVEKFFKDLDSDAATLEAEVGYSTRHHQSGQIYRAEINLSVSGQFFRAEAVNDDLYAAIDEIKDELEREIKKFRAKRATIFIRGARSLKKKFSLSPWSRFRKKS